MGRRSGRASGSLRELNLGFATVWYSYDTMVAFQFQGEQLVVSENIWSQTTARHLSAIDGGSEEAKWERKSRDWFLWLWNDGRGRPNQDKELDVATKSRDIVRRA